MKTEILIQKVVELLGNGGKNVYIGMEGGIILQIVDIIFDEDNDIIIKVD